MNQSYVKRLLKQLIKDVSNITDPELIKRFDENIKILTEGLELKFVFRAHRPKLEENFKYIAENFKRS